MEYSKYTKKEDSSKPWPWILRWLSPYNATDRERFIVKCSCGRVMWSDAPQKIRRLHDGHTSRVCERGSFLEFLKMKLNLLNFLTVGEHCQLFLQKRGWK